MECTHGLIPCFCPRCADGRPAWVLRTMDGSAYHGRADCERLTAGEQPNHRRGLVEHAVERITLTEAEAYLYEPCPACTQPRSTGLPREPVWANVPG